MEVAILEVNKYTKSGIFKIIDILTYIGYSSPNNVKRQIDVVSDDNNSLVLVIHDFNYNRGNYHVEFRPTLKPTIRLTSDSSVSSYLSLTVYSILNEK